MDQLPGRSRPSAAEPKPRSHVPSSHPAAHAAAQPPVHAASHAHPSQTGTGGGGAPGLDRPSSRRRRRRPGRPSEPAPGSAAPLATAAAAEPVAAAKPWTPADFDVAPVEGKTRFQDLDLPQEILHAVADLGFRYCMPVQGGCLPPALSGRNITGRAQTGTGKTAAFLISIFSRFLRSGPADTSRGRSPRALILAPTRELAVQILNDAVGLGKYTPFRATAVYGGTEVRRQQADVERGVDVMIATPGRLLDFMQRGHIVLQNVEVLVIDEADRMLDMGFIPDVTRIIRRLPPAEKRQTMLFSATLTKEVLRLSSHWVPDPAIVEIEPDQVTNDQVKPIVYAVTASKKFTVLYNLLEQKGMDRVLIFANRRDQTSRIADELERHGVTCAVLSGDVEQGRRMRVLEAFKKGELRVLVATDVAARGLHIDAVSHVINFDFPYEPESYVHRIGRTGRAGATGIAISFACEDESFSVPEIEAYIGEPLPCIQPEEALLKPLPPPLRAPTPPVRHESRGRYERSGHGSGDRGHGRRDSRRR